MKITLLGSPLSTQHLYRTACIGKRPRLYMTKEGKEKKAQYQWEAKAQYKGEPLKGNIEMEIILFFKDLRKRDIDNYNKIVLDALESFLYNDDRQIVQLTIQKKIDRLEPRIEVLVGKSSK